MDEYDSYARHICSMLLTGDNDVGNIANYLAEVEQNSIGLSVPDDASKLLIPVAEKLIESYNSLLSSGYLK